jgi:hypothetical protein
LQDIWKQLRSVLGGNLNEINFNEQFSNCYLIQHYVIKFFQDLRKVVGFLRVTLVSSTNKNEHHDITEILLKMVLNTINQLNPTNFPLKPEQNLNSQLQW